jgi:hypothetical protein
MFAANVVVERTVDSDHWLVLMRSVRRGDDEILQMKPLKLRRIAGGSPTCQEQEDPYQRKHLVEYQTRATGLMETKLLGK